MGNKNQKSQQNNQVFNSQIKHPKLSLAKVIKPYSQNQQPYLQIAQTVQNKQIYEKWKLRILKYSVDQNEIQTILVPRSISFEQKGICGSSGIIKAQYAMLPYVLSEEIDNRAVLKQPFLEKQLWYLIYILNIAGSTVHSRSLILGDIRPHNVLMSFDGQICVCCLETFLDEQKNFIKTMKLKTKTYLAPEQIKDLQEGKTQPTEDERISQSFSIGLTALSAIVLKDLQYLYGNDLTFNQKGLNNQIINMKNKNQYSKSLKNLIEGLLLKDQKQRLQCLQVVQILKPYEQQIINLEDFILQNLQTNTNTQINTIRNSNNIEASPHALKSSRQIQLAKVINNNDYNKNSRVNYQNRNNQLSKVINNSDLNKNSRVRYNLAPFQNNPYSESKFQFTTINKNNIYQGPAQTQIQSNPQPQPQSQTINNQSVISHQLSRNQETPIIMTQSFYTQIPNVNGLKSPGQQGLYNHIQSQRPFQSIVVQSTSQNKQLIQRTGQSPFPGSYIHPNIPIQVNKPSINQNPNQSVYQNPIQSTNQVFSQAKINQIPNQYLNIPSAPNQGYSNIHSGIKSPEFFTYISKLDSNIHNFQPQQHPIMKQPEQKNNETSANNLYTKNEPVIERNTKQTNQVNTNPNGGSFAPIRNLSQIRDANSIKPPPERIFQTYEEAMKNIDQKLRQSKKMFPDDP